MRASVSILLLVGFFLGLPFFLLRYDLETAAALEQAKEFEGIQETARVRLETVRKAATPFIQLNLTLGQLANQSWEAEGLDGQRRLHRRYARTTAGLLPRHDLLVMSVASAPRVVFARKRGLGLSNRLGRVFAAWATNPRRAERWIPWLTAELSRVFRFPVSDRYLAGTFRTWNGTMQVFRSVEGSVGMFFFIRPGTREAPPLVFLAALELGELPRDFSLQASIKREASGEVGLAFLSGPRRTIMANRFFTQHPHLWGRLRRAARERLTLPLSELVDGVAVFRSLPIPGTSFVPVMAFPLRAGRDRAWESGLFAAMGLAFLIAFWFAVERLVFGRGQELGLRLTILGAFLMVTLPPLASTGSVFRTAIAEQEKKAALSLALDLHEELNTIDQGYIYFQAEMVRWMREFGRRPAFVAHLQAEDRPDGARGFLASYVRDFESFLRTPMHPASWPIYSTVGVMGPQEYFRSWPENPAKESLSGKGDDFLRTLSYLRKPELEGIQANREGPGPDRRRRAAASEKMMDPHEIFLEMAYDRFGALGGLDIFLETLHFPNRMAFFTTANGQASFLFTPAVAQGKLRYVMVWVWRGLMSELSYLYQLIVVLADRRGAEVVDSPPALDQGGTMRPPNGPRKTGTVYALQRKPRKWLGAVPRLLPESPLHELAERADGSGQTIKATTGMGAGGMVLEARRCRNITKFILAGGKDTEVIAGGTRRLRLLFRLAMGISFLLAMLVASLGANHVLHPLAELERGLQAVHAEDYTMRLDESRPDEFGSLAKAFNEMTRGLEEGRMLRRFVSTAVHRAVEGEGPEIAAGQGTTCDVTVLFSSLAGFDAFQQEHGAAEVFRVMEAHLEAFIRVLPGTGGEIDKVIGDKILVVFRHGESGGPTATMRAVLRIVGQVTSILADSSPLGAAIGVNTGPVISGILGAPTVRLDLTVIGDTVNLAARLATLAHTLPAGRQAIFSDHAARLLPAGTALEKLPFRRVKGKTQEVEAFTLAAPTPSLTPTPNPPAA